ncbi:hypothetical protein [Paracerasibacillus soli]|uniref:Uncharacterized protein n=1 Tax=Paracerasibacillus soli TaxID=480284 RepID=A0ABU5CTU9_9BACI|nr:hypothetical protein [Virgibacillus soli]MDY0409301.1 hypothetical protein [Virgibacillus soli]
MNRFVTILLFTVLLFTMYLVVNSKIAGGHASIFGYQIKTVLSVQWSRTFKRVRLYLLKQEEI